MEWPKLLLHPLHWDLAESGPKTSTSFFLLWTENLAQVAAAPRHARSGNRNDPSSPCLKSI